MERKFDKILQEKILTEERRPLPWRKEATWERIHTKSSPQRTWMPYFYAAASVAVVIVATYILWEQPRSTADTSHPAMSEVFEIVVPAETQTTAKPTTKAQEISGDEHRKVIVSQRKLSAELVIENHPGDSSDSETIPTQVTVTTVDENMILAAEENSKQKVRPVIGVVIVQPSEPMMVTKKKNNKLRFLPRHNDAPKLSVPEPTTLTARIN